MNDMWILAAAPSGQPSAVKSQPVGEEQTTSVTVAADPNTPVGQGPRPKPLIPIWLFMVLMIVLLFFMFRAPQKQRQERKRMRESLQKNDKVQTIGGIIGTIVDIKGDEITLKVDESNNTKIKVVASAIGRNLSKDKDR